MNVVDLLQQLVRIPSVNPEDTPGTVHVGEQVLAEFLVPLLEGIGYSVRLEDVREGRPNLIARAPGSENRPRILLGPHLDTVGVAGMTIEPFSGDISNGRILGRGASDTKGPMAAMIVALAQMKEQLATLPVAVDFVAFMGEESSQWGSKHFGKNYGRDYVFALVGEPTSCDIVFANKGSLWAKLVATGKAAHSSKPHLGDNAVLKLARSLDYLNRKLTNRLATYDHPVLGHATFNVGTLNGGTRPNIVPDYAESLIDIRTTPPLDSAGGALPLLKEVIDQAKLPVSVESPAESPSMETDLQNPYVQQLQKSSAGTQLVGAPWFSDAALLSDAGIASVCAGPGSIDQAHTADEFIEISDLESGVEFYSAFLRSFADG